MDPKEAEDMKKKISEVVVDLTTLITVSIIAAIIFPSNKNDQSDNIIRRDPDGRVSGFGADNAFGICRGNGNLFGSGPRQYGN